ncbi:MAG: DNA translocase FtsK 4TM domain-containing protein, partial [Bacteroidota bacterium]
MAKKKTAKSKKSRSARKKVSFSLSRQQKIILGSAFIILALAMFFSFVSYFFSWKADMSIDGLDGDGEAANWLTVVGNFLGDLFIHKGIGISAFIIAFLVGLTGVYFFFDYARKQLLTFWFWGLMMALWLSVFFGFFSDTNTMFSGVTGFEINDLLQQYMGLIGTILLMTFLAIVYMVIRLKMTPEKVSAAIGRTKKEIVADFSSEEEPSAEVERSDYEKEVVETLVTEPEPEP